MDLVFPLLPLLYLISSFSVVKGEFTQKTNHSLLTTMSLKRWVKFLPQNTSRVSKVNVFAAESSASEVNMSFKHKKQKLKIQPELVLFVVCIQHKFSLKFTDTWMAPHEQSGGIFSPIVSFMTSPTSLLTIAHILLAQ